ncbi:MAG: adenylate/guanylate cyclase domain-containing protein [Bacteriovoracia bacterium]
MVTKRGRTLTLGQSTPLRLATLWLLVGVAFVTGLSFYKSHKLEAFARDCLGSVTEKHAKVRNLFQANFYFFYEDQFIPGIKAELDSDSRLDRIEVISNSGAVLFDSAHPPKTAAAPSQPGSERLAPPEVVSKLNEDAPSMFRRNYDVQILIPSGQFGVLYTYGGAYIRIQILLIFLGVLAAFGFAMWAVRRLQSPVYWAMYSRWTRRLVGLRAKFLVTIVAVNVITGAIVFFSLSRLQTNEQMDKITRNSVLFAQFSTNKVISDFSSFFYFYYQDKFVPAIRNIIATDENLVGIRIISTRTRAVLFDSETDTVASAGSAPMEARAAGGGDKAKFPEEAEKQLKNAGFYNTLVDRGGEKLLSVINTYHNENHEALFFVEYLFSFHTLKRSIAAIRLQILIDLVPSMAIGLLIAVLFSQLLISPIRRLSGALRAVSEGDYDVTVQMNRSDEIGDLLTAFNSMTFELRKKKELRKYLSDSTYRQIMAAPDAPGARLKGTRVPATVLFSDIRNFVNHCESMDAEEVTSMLSEYFSEMVEIVYKYGGEVDKFIGDAILAVFYASDEVRTIRGDDYVPGPNAQTTALNAIYCALEMRERLADFNQKRLADQKRTIEIGVGITHGEIISGPIGSKDRMDFTVIGDVVNLANRIEKLSKLGQHTRIVFSNHVEDKVRGLLEYANLSKEKVRGKEEEVTVFELIRIRDLAIILRNIQAPDIDLKIRSIGLLGHSKNFEAIPHLVKLLDDPEERVRQEAVSSLVRLAPMNDPVALDAVFARLRIEKSEKVQSAMISAVGRLCSTERVLELAGFLESRAERIVANAIEAMGQVRDPRCSDLILPRLGSRNNRVKANAAMALFAAGHVGVIDSLKPMLMHSDPLMRSSAAFAIGELTLLAQRQQLLEEWKAKGDQVKVFLGELQECVPMLVSLLKDREPMVKRQAIVALGKIKDKSAVLPIIDNIDLEHDSKELIRDVGQALRSIGSHKLVREILEKLT